jgi:Flp pilus assembly protein TadD
MHKFVQRAMRGVIFFSVSIAIVACAGSTDVADRERDRQSAVPQSEEGLPRIDAIRLRVARNALENGDYNTAIRFFESVRKSSPSHAAPILGLARAHLAAGSHEEAMLAYRDALELDSDNIDALDGMGRSLVLTGNYREAIDYFNRLLDEAPSAALHNRLGVAHDLSGDGEGAQRHYRAALELDPEAISPRNNLALSLAISEQYEQAIKEMERVAAHPQATSKHRQNLTFVYGMAGENNTRAAAFSERGLTATEIAKKRALYKRIRELSQAGQHAEILEYLRNGKKISDPMIMPTRLAEPTDESNSGSGMASLPTESDRRRTGSNSSATMDEVMPPKPMAKRKKTSKMNGSEKTRMAKIAPNRSRSARAPKRRGGAVRDGFYRVQLAAYRTSRTAARGVKIIQSLVREGVSDLEILVKKIRNKEKRMIDYRIRTPRVPNRDAAMEFCTKVRTAGHPDCLVILHNPRVWAGVDLPELVPGAKFTGIPKHGNYRLQLASYRTERGAAKGQAILKKLLGDRGVNLDILVRRTKKAGPKAFNYQIRTNTIKTRDEGASLCAALRKAGHAGCLVVQHSDQVWKRAGPRDTASLDDPKARNEAGSMPNPATARLTTKTPTGSKGADETTYRLQLASFRTEQGAAKGKAKLRKLLGNRTNSLHIVVRREKSTNTASFDYQIRTGPLNNLTEGADICEALIKAGHNGCLVVQHIDLQWKILANRAGPSLASSRADTEGSQIKQDHVNKGRLKQDLIKKGQMKQGQNSDDTENNPWITKTTPSDTKSETPLRNITLPSYRVQLASYRTERGAAKGQAILRKLLGDRDISLDILVRRSRRDGPAAFDYQIRTGAIKSRTEGIGLCETLKKAGHLGCLVVEHNDHFWNSLAGQPAERDKASLDSPPVRTSHAGSNGHDAAGPAPGGVIEIPSSTVMEADLIRSTDSRGMAAEPVKTPLALSMVNI